MTLKEQFENSGLNLFDWICQFDGCNFTEEQFDEMGEISGVFERIIVKQDNNGYMYQLKFKSDFSYIDHIILYCDYKIENCVYY